MAKKQPRLPTDYRKNLTPELAAYLAELQEYIASLEARIKALEP